MCFQIDKSRNLLSSEDLWRSCWYLRCNRSEFSGKWSLSWHQSLSVWRLQSLWLQTYLCHLQNRLLSSVYTLIPMCIIPKLDFKGERVWGYFLTVMILLSDTIHNVKVWAIFLAGARSAPPQRVALSPPSSHCCITNNSITRQGLNVLWLRMNMIYTCFNWLPWWRTVTTS